MDSEQPSIFSSPTPSASGSKKKIVVISIVVASVVMVIGLLVLGVLVILSLVNSVDNSPSPLFHNWLKPASEIKVGDNRYKSACQVLPVNYVTKTFGNFKSDTNISETYLDQSYNLQTNPVETSCRYIYGGSSLTGEVVDLQMKQFASKDGVKKLYDSISTNATGAAEKLKKFEKAVDKSPNEDAKALVATLKASGPKYDKYAYASDDDLKAFNPDGLAVISDAGIDLGSDIAISMIYDNVVYTLGVSEHGGITSDLDKYSNNEISKVLGQIKKTFDVIKINSYNKSLDQSPSPTVIGRKDKVGETPVLESCAVLTSDVFGAVVEKPDNSPVERATLPYDLTKKRHASATKEVLLPDNTCKRTYSTRNASEEGSGNLAAHEDSVSITLDHADSESMAKSWINDVIYINPKTDTVLQTEADWALATRYGVDTDTPSTYYEFRVGAYIVDITIDVTDSTDLQSDIIQTTGTEAQYLKLINELTRSLKANLAVAQKN